MFHIKLLSRYLVPSVFLVFVQGQTPEAPKVCTFDAGCFIGHYMDGYRIDKFEAFLGIPYAHKPRRFHVAKRFYSNQTYEATESYACVQKNYFTPSWRVTGTEDCLYLNVYRPMKKPKDFFPVILYIHGGGFFSGTSAPIFTGPEFIIDREDTMVVTITYRLGAFGFLATDDGVIPGNLGLKDQSEALQWVYRNIESFGGDRFRITLMGQNAGAVSVHMHMFSKLSSRLFYAAIVISGTANTPYAIDENPEHTARQTARYCNISNWDTLSTGELAKELEDIPMYRLLDAGDHLKYWDVDSLFNYKPIVEDDDPLAFLVKHPHEYIRKGDYKPVPIMFGRVPNEGAVRAVGIMESKILREDFNEDFFDLMVKFFEFPQKFNIYQQIEKTKLILNEYLKENHELSDETLDDFVDMLTHRFFFHPLYNTIKYYVQTIDTNKYPVYWYNFNYIGNYSFSEIYAGHRLVYDYGVIHSDDLIYLLRQRLLFGDFPKNSPESSAIETYVKVLVSFAQTTKLLYIDSEFESCNKSTFFPKEGRVCDYFEFINSSNDSAIIRSNDVFDTKRMQFWDDILK